MPDIQVPQTPMAQPNQNQPMQANQLTDEQINNFIMQYLFNQINKPRQDQQQMDQQKAAEIKSKSGIEGLLEALLGKGQFGNQPHMATLENILARLEPTSAQQMNQSPFGNTRSSSYMNAQNLANKPLTWGQKAGQFVGNALQDFSPVAGAAGIGAFGPLGALAGPAIDFTGRQLSNYSQPYQLPT
jgi:hypothetical protein